MLRIRPHHLIDIIRNIGLHYPVKPHPFGHDQHMITMDIIDGKIDHIQLVIASDDLCRPCRNLNEKGVCTDVLFQTDEHLSKQIYNDKLDAVLMHFLHLNEGIILTPEEFLNIIELRLSDVVLLSTHPGEDTKIREAGIKAGIRKLRSKSSV